MKRIVILLIPTILALTSPGIAKDIDLMFPRAAKSGEEAKSAYYGKRPTETWVLFRADGEKDEKEYEVVALKKFIKEFTGYKIKLIELWIETRVETEGVTKLFISAERTGGAKLVLEPK